MPRLVFVGARHRLRAACGLGVVLHPMATEVSLFLVPRRVVEAGNVSRRRAKRVMALSRHVETERVNRPSWGFTLWYPHEAKINKLQSIREACFETNHAPGKQNATD